MNPDQIVHPTNPAIMTSKPAVALESNTLTGVQKVDSKYILYMSKKICAFLKCSCLVFVIGRRTWPPLCHRQRDFAFALALRFRIHQTWVRIAFVIRIGFGKREEPFGLTGMLSCYSYWRFSCPVLKYAEVFLERGHRPTCLY